MGWLSSFGSLAGDAFKNSAGSIVSSIGSIFTNKDNRENQDYWNERQIQLADTAHQRAVKDLEAAGLNPILAANSAASTPSLTSARMENPLSDFGRNSRDLAKALTGMTTAEVNSAKANAKSDMAYADRADEIVAAEVSSAQAQNSLAHSQARVLELESYADRIEQLARIEALQGHRPGEVNDLVGKWSGGKKVGMEVYDNLVQKFKNEIQTGRYKSSIERQFTSDLLSGASSASGIYRDLRGGKSTINKNVNIRRTP